MIKTNQFCALANSKDFQSWLLANAQDLHQKLMADVNKGGCRKNRKIMLDIYSRLCDRDLEPTLLSFLRNKYPTIIDGGPKKISNASPVKPVQRKLKKSRPKKVESLNKHNVFSSYRPGLLTFPQKMILTGDPSEIEGLVKKFVRDKVGADYIIIDDHAYIEYFEAKYGDIVKQIPPEKREIYAYKMRSRQIK